MTQPFFSKPYRAFFGSLCFTGLGIYALFQPDLFGRILGLLSVLFFGPGACVLLWRDIHTTVGSPASPWASTAEQIEVTRQAPSDNETLEQWTRTGANLNQSFQGVSASRSDSAEFAWGLTISSGEFVRQGTLAERYSHEIHTALCSVAGAKVVVREDNEYWAIDGDCNGEALVRAAALANDRVLSLSGEYQ